MRFWHRNVWFFCGVLFMFPIQTHTSDTISWKIICVTSHVRIAESIADQRMILNGVKGNSNTINLDWTKGRFKFNVTDIFFALTKDVGHLKKITMWNNDKRPGPIWVATNITIENLDDGSLYQTTEKKIYVGRNKIDYLVITISKTTTQSPEPTFSQETLMPSYSSSQSSSTETEIITLLDTSTVEVTVPPTAFASEESASTLDNGISTDDTVNTVTTDDLIKSVTTEATSNTWTDDTMEIVTTNTPINVTITTTTSRTTVAISNATNATINSSTPVPMCVCPCAKKLTKEEQIEQLKEIKKELTIEKKKTSRYIRKKISVPDNRISAKATGYVGIILLICPFAAILACDLMDLAVYLKAKYNASKV